MSIRHIALYLFVAGLSIYAWKDWFKSLCGLILLMAVIEHNDMPKTMFGFQGLNPWNVLFLAVFLAWFVNRGHEGLTWDMPRHITMLLLMYVGIILIGVLRAVFDRSYIEDYPLKSLINEELINTIKWILPGLLLFDGCRTRKRVLMAVVCVLAMYFVLAVLVVRQIPPEAALRGGWVMINARSKLDKELGHHSTELATVFSGACWGTMAVLPLIRRKCFRTVVLAAAGVFAYGLALTGGRGGYVAWGATGLIMCLIKWRKYLLLAPVVVLLLPIVFPGAAARMLTGFGQTDAAGQATVDDVAASAGRTLFWPHIIDKIGESPWVGYGRLAMQRTGLKEYLLEKYGPSEAVAHPHNMYLQTLIDNGILGSIPIWLLFAVIVIYSAILFRSSNRLYSAVGGLALALMLANLISGLFAEHYYPREHTMGVWTAMFLMLRVYVEEKRVRMDAIYAENSWNNQVLMRHQIAIASGYA